MPSAVEEVTLYREPLAVAAAPAHAALALRGDDRPFALIGAWAGGGAVLGSEPVRVAGGDDDLFAVLDDVPVVRGRAAPTAGAGQGGAARGGRLRRRGGGRT